MREEYLKAFAEVEQIIKLMPESLQRKIPYKFKNIISTEKSQTYMPNIKEPFEPSSIMEETKIILAVIYMDFLCGEDEKEKIKLNDLHKVKEYEKELREQYNTDNIFETVKNSSSKSHMEESECLTIVKERCFLRRMFDNIRNLFYKK